MADGDRSATDSRGQSNGSTLSLCCNRSAQSQIASKTGSDRTISVGGGWLGVDEEQTVHGRSGSQPDRRDRRPKQRHSIEYHFANWPTGCVRGPAGSGDRWLVDRLGGPAQTASSAESLEGTCEPSQPANGRISIGPDSSPFSNFKDRLRIHQWSRWFRLQAHLRVVVHRAAGRLGGSEAKAVGLEKQIKINHQDQH